MIWISGPTSWDCNFLLCKMGIKSLYLQALLGNECSFSGKESAQYLLFHASCQQIPSWPQTRHLPCPHLLRVPPPTSPYPTCSPRPPLQVLSGGLCLLEAPKEGGMGHLSKGPLPCLASHIRLRMVPRPHRRFFGRNSLILPSAGPLPAGSPWAGPTLSCKPAPNCSPFSSFTLASLGGPAPSGSHTPPPTPHLQAAPVLVSDLPQQESPCPAPEDGPSSQALPQGLATTDLVRRGASEHPPPPPPHPFQQHPFLRPFPSRPVPGQHPPSRPPSVPHLQAQLQRNAQQRGVGRRAGRGGRFAGVLRQLEEQGRRVDVLLDGAQYRMQPLGVSWGAGREEGSVSTPGASPCCCLTCSHRFLHPGVRV